MICFYHISDTNVGGGTFLTSTNFPVLWTLTRDPTTQFNSDTNYPESAQTLQIKDSVTQDCPHFRCQLQVLGSCISPKQLAINQGFSQCRPWIWAFARMAQRTQTHTHTHTHTQECTYYYQIIIKDTSEPLDEEVHRVKSGRVLSTETSVRIKLGGATLTSQLMDMSSIM